MKIKGLIALLLALLLPVCAMAEVMERESLMDAAVQVNRWMDAAEACVEELADEEAESLYQTMGNMLSVAVHALMDAMEPEGDFDDKVGDLQGYVPQINREKNSYASGTRWIREMGVYCEAEVSYTDNYLCSLLVMYQKDGTLIGIQRVEMAKQGEDFIALLVDYDHAEWMTGRFAMYPQQENSRVIYTKTLGQNLDIALDVKAWSEGADTGAWDKNLLLPMVIE